MAEVDFYQIVFELFFILESFFLFLGHWFIVTASAVKESLFFSKSFALCLSSYTDFISFYATQTHKYILLSAYMLSDVQWIHNRRVHKSPL